MKSILSIIAFMGLFLSACSAPEEPKNFYCATPAGIQHFTSPQAAFTWNAKFKQAYVTVTNPGTLQRLDIPAQLCIVVTGGE